MVLVVFLAKNVRETPKKGEVIENIKKSPQWEDFENKYYHFFINVMISSANAKL